MASAMDRVQNLQSEIICGICWHCSSHPVTMDCGHSFCQECLSWSWRVGATPFSCPECRQVSQIRELENLADFWFSCHHLQSATGQRLRSPEGQNLQSSEGQGQNLQSPEGQRLRSTEEQGQNPRSPEGQNLQSPEGQSPRSPEEQRQNFQSLEGQRLRSTEEQGQNPRSPEGQNLQSPRSPEEQGQNFQSPEGQRLRSTEEQGQNPRSPEGQNLQSPEGQSPRSPEEQGQNFQSPEGQRLRSTEEQGQNPRSPEGQRPRSPEGQRQCPTHKEVLKFFCEEDQTLLCVSCCQMSEHRAHKLCPVEEAVHNYKEKLQEILSHLRKDFEEAEKLLFQEEVEKPPVDWGWMITEQYCKLQYFLMEEVFQYLGNLKKEKSTSKAGLSWHIQTLRGIMREVDESSQKSNIDLLEDFRELWGRSESVLAQRPKTVSQELRQFTITGIIDILNKFRVDIRVDPAYDCTYVRVSEDLKSMRAGEGWQVELNQPEDSPCHYVFAEQFFTSGRHYWEVDVTQVPQWILGVYTPYLTTGMGRNFSSCASVFLLRCVKKEDHYNLQTYPGTLNHQVKDPVPKVGVYLEYSLGAVVFYNVLQSSLIYRFCPIPFTEPVSPVFSPGPPLPGTKPGPMTIC